MRIKTWHLIVLLIIVLHILTREKGQPVRPAQPARQFITSSIPPSLRTPEENRKLSKLEEISRDIGQGTGIVKEATTLATELKKLGDTLTPKDLAPITPQTS